MDNPGYDTDTGPVELPVNGTKSRERTLNDIEMQPASKTALGYETQGYQNGHAVAGGPPPAKPAPDAESAHAHSEPWRFSRWLVEYPRTVFFVTLGLHVFMLFLFIILFAARFPILPLVFDDLPLDFRNNEDYLRGLAWQYRDDEDANKVIMERKFTPDQQDPRSQFREKIDFFYEDQKDGNLFKKDKLERIKAIEDDLFFIDEFQDDFCMLRGGACIKPTSIMRFFDGTFESVDPVFNDPNFEDITNVIWAAYEKNETKGTLEYVLAEDAKIRPTGSETHALRSYMSIGYPLEGYRDNEDDEEDQDDDVNKFYEKTFTEKANKHYEKARDNINFYYNSGLLMQDFILNSVFRDILLFIGSFSFIFFFMWFQTESLFITFFGIISVVNGFIITDILYILILQYEYVGIFHVLTLFIVLGIGADGIFVFMDTWKDSGFQQWPSLAHRMDHCYKHSAEALLYTSLTTACAFFVSGASPLLAISSFGIFSGILICVNYFSVILHFPAIIAVHHAYFDKYKCCCCCPVEGADDEGGVPAEQKKSAIVRFLGGKYWAFITHKYVKFIVLGVFACIIGVFIFFCTRLSVDEEQVKFVQPSTNFGAAQNIAPEEFGVGENPQRVFLVWGLKKQDIDKCGFSDPECWGKTRFDNGFSLGDTAVQQELLEFCDKLKTGLSSSQIKDLKIKRNIVTRQPEVDCFLHEMRDFLQEDETRNVTNPATHVTEPRYPDGTELAFPVTEQTTTTIMDNVDYIYNTSLVTAARDQRWFEIAMSYWLYDGMQVSADTNQTVLGPQFAYFSPLLGVSKTDDFIITLNDVNDYANFEYRYNTRIKFAAITVNLTLKPLTLAFPDGLPVRDEWEDFMDKELKDMSSALKDGFQCTPADYYGFDLWHWLSVQENLANSAFQGVGVGLLLALPILIVATKNWIMGLLCTLTIALITLCVFGFIPMMGWKLGVLESLNLVLVVGLAVDYCVHLAEGYARAKHTDRTSRVQNALEEVGISVLSGAVTTLGSSFFLMFSIIVFFFRFGIFMFATIGFSIVFSMVFLMALLATIGPQGDSGSIMPAYRWLKRKCNCCCRK